MKAKEFTSFEDKHPEKNRHIIVTNNLNSIDAHGNMSHVWLTLFFTASKTEGSIITFDDADRKIINLTHWKYV